MPQKHKQIQKKGRRKTKRIGFDILSLFPKAFSGYFQTSIIKRGQSNKLISIRLHNIRDFAADKHKTTDEKPYGGGPGMVMKVGPIYKAIKHVLSSRPTRRRQATRILALSAKGKFFTQQDARRLSGYERIIIICGRYEGIDERIIKYCADEEISIGPYILTGGEIPAMVIVDAVSRYIPGVLGKAESLKQESFSQINYREYPHYTRPEKLVIKPLKSSLGNRPRTASVPKVLVSGNHKKIDEWRKRHSKQ